MADSYPDEANASVARRESNTVEHNSHSEKWQSEVVRACDAKFGGQGGGWSLQLRFSWIPRTAVLLAKTLIAAQCSVALLTLVSYFNHDHRGPTTVSGLACVTEVSDSESVLQNKEMPWGRLEYKAIMISPPLEFVRLVDPQQYISDWYFPKISREALGALLVDFGLSGPIHEKLLGLSEIDASSNRRRIRVTNALISEIPIDVRGKVYSYLEQDTLNGAQAGAFRTTCNSVDEWFEDSAIRTELRDRIQSMVYRQGCYLVFADIRLLLPEMRDAQEISKLLSVLTRVKTFIVTLEVDQDSNAAKLWRYWGRRGRAKEVGMLIASLSLKPSGGSIDVTHLLPPFARRRLYAFPNPSPDPLRARQDCHWTTHNFFNSVPDNLLAADRNALSDLLDKEYYEVYGDLRFGDLLMYVDESDNAFHSAVYIADDVVFTKNGPDPLRPWYFCRLAEMMDFYPRREPVRILYYRHKKS